jgi:hypothetical protein
MSAPIPLRRDFDASQLLTEAAKIGGIGLQIIRDWCCASTLAGLTLS